MQPPSDHAHIPDLPIDFGAAFEMMPGNRALINNDSPRYTILAVTNDYEKVSVKNRSELVGKGLFDIFPANPHDPNSMGYVQLRNSFDYIMEHKTESKLAGQRYDVINKDGVFEERYWTITNRPVLDQVGKVKYIVHDTIEVTGEKALEKREQNIRNIFIQAPVSVALYRGSDFIVEIANAHTLEHWGRSSEEVLGKPIFEVMKEAKDQGYHELMTKVYNTGVPHRAYGVPVSLMRNGKNCIVYVSFVYEPYRDSDGNITGVMSVSTEVTNETLARQKIEASEKEFRELADSLPELVWTTDNQGAQTFASRRWKEYTGLDPYDEHTFSQVVHPADLESILKIWKESLLSGKTYVTEVRLKSKTGEYNWFYVKGEPIENENGGIKKWVGAFTNVNAQKITEDNLKLTSERFQVLADSMPQFVWTGDATGNLNYYNRAVYDYSGLTIEEILNDGWLQIVHPEEREENIRQWIEAVTTGNDFVFAHRFRRYDGKYRWQLSRAVPQRDAEGNIQMWIGTSTDIHELKEMDEQKDFFIAMVSHELKTPITSMKGYVQILQSKYKNTGDAFLKSSLETVNKQIAKTSKLISELLDVSKIKSGSLSLNREKFSLNQLIREVINEVIHINPGYRIIFDKQFYAPVIADKERISQVMVNLLTNAIKYSPDNNEVVVECTPSDTYVLVVVKDRGIGISKTDQEKIFERFYRVEGKNENKFTGFGIGLFIASEIIHKHYGRIGVTSEPGKGSVFYFELPMVIEDVK